MATPNIALWQISDVSNELAAMGHGTTLNQIQNLYGAYDRAARRILGDVDPQETKVVSQFGKLYDGVWDYPLAVDVKGNKIVDLFPQANRQLTDNFRQSYNKEFDLWKNFNLTPDFTPRYASGVRTIRINATELNTGIQINSASGYNTNGTWVAGTNVSNVQTNNQYFQDGNSGSVSFQINQTGIASTATITNSTMGAVDLTNHYNNADEFFSFYIPNAAGITGIRYIFGTNSTNYYDSGVLTVDGQNNSFVNGWNTCMENWSTFTTTGTPTISNIAYISIQISYNGTLQTQVLLNSFWSRLGVIFNQEYYSKYLFRTSSGVFQERVSGDDNYVNLDTDAINMFVFATLGEVVQQQQGLEALFFDANQAEQHYQAELTKYRAKYKSEVEKPKTYYYRTPNPSYRQWIGRGYRTP